MIAKVLTLADRPYAALYAERIPGHEPEGFWRRVASGFYIPVLLLDRARSPWGLLVASVNETEHGRELWLQLSAAAGLASKNRSGLLYLIDRLAQTHEADRVVFESKRRGWAAVAEGLGFTAEPVTRYSKEVH